MLTGRDKQRLLNAIKAGGENTHPPSAATRNKLRLQDWAPIVVGKLDGALNEDGSADFSVWYFNGSTFADTGRTIEVWDWLLPNSTVLASGTRCVAAFISGAWVIVSAEC